MKRAGTDIFQKKKYKPSTQVIIRETSIRTMRYSFESVELAVIQSLKVGDGEDEAQNDLVYCCENIS